MGDPKAFLTEQRRTPTSRPVMVRLKDWNEVYEPMPADEVSLQASRCMDCGIPFCNNGCPLGNLIPDWNDLVYRSQWHAAIEALHATNNFPEFTGRLCPAPCEAACVAGISTEAVSIKNVELNIIERAWAEGWVEPVIASKKTGKSVAVVGSGPAGLAAAQQLTRAGHAVTVFERADRIGGLLRYGIPEFKMEKWVLDRRLGQMEAEGTTFRTKVYVGGPEDHPDRIPAVDLTDEFDAVVLAGGATDWRDLPVPGRELDGIHQAMEYLPLANRVQEGDLDEPPITAVGKAVVIIGGGDTGADCLGTANRQGARSVHQLEIMPRPPDHRSESTPWPTWPLMMRTASAHEEGVEQLYAVSTSEFVGSDGAVTHLRGHRVDVQFVDGRPSFVPVEGSEFELEAELVLLAMGFTGPETTSVVTELDLEVEGGRVKRDGNWRTSRPGVFTCGDMGRGQSLIVWAIAEGRACAAAVDAELMGSTLLPSPVRPTDRPLT
ncbi:MAG: glutamate synthase subunit beta [Acidimicrobiia bacterium]|nr:glutamate synthase subunit beta [Acidimicrobiia bacterium]